MTKAILGILALTATLLIGCSDDEAAGTTGGNTSVGGTGGEAGTGGGAGTGGDADSYVQVSAGVYHTCGVKGDGSVACWGRDVEGQTTPPLGTFTQVAAGTATRPLPPSRYPRGNTAPTPPTGVPPELRQA